MKVFTTKGLIEMSELRVQDIVEVGDNYRKIATEYFLGDELVRRSVTAEALRPLVSEAVLGDFNG